MSKGIPSRVVHGQTLMVEMTDSTGRTVLVTGQVKTIKNAVGQGGLVGVVLDDCTMIPKIH